MIPNHRYPTLGLLAVLLAGGCSDSPTEGGDPASARFFDCDTALEGGTLRNVVVHAGNTCDLSAVAVQGNIQVKDGGSLILLGGTVAGNVQADEVAAVEIRATEVGGNVQVEEAGSVLVVDAIVRGDIQVKKTRDPAAGSVVITGNDVLTGNIQVEENHVLVLDISRNIVRKGNLQIMKNLGGGTKVVSENTVAQNLQCQENSQPFTAADNSAGDREGQCE